VPVAGIFFDLGLRDYSFERVTMRSDDMRARMPGRGSRLLRLW
jgi:hypothetical protein